MLRSEKNVFGYMTVRIWSSSLSAKKSMVPVSVSAAPLFRSIHATEYFKVITLYLRNMKTGSSENSDRLLIPTFIAYAENERIVRNQAILNFKNAGGSNIQIKGYDAYHPIHTDINRARLYQECIAFLNEHGRP